MRTISGGRSGGTPTTEDAHQALVVMQRYTIGLSHAIEGVLNAGTTGNLDIGLLLVVQSRPGVSPSDLPHATNSPRSTAARAVARLLDAGLLARRSDVADRRRAELVLTPRGRRRVKRMEHTLESYFRDSESLVKEVLHLMARPPRRAAAGSAMSALDVLAELTRAGRATRADVAQAAQPLGLALLVDRFALMSIALSEARPSQLSHELLLTPAGTTSLLDRLTSRGLVERTARAVETDRRAVVVRATPAGRRAAAAIVSTYTPHLGSLADALELTLDRD